MKLQEAKELLNKKIPNTHITLLQDLGLKIIKGYSRHFFAVQCDCGATKEYKVEHLGSKAKTCGQIKTCPYATNLWLAGSKKGALISSVNQHKRAILLENKQHGFVLLKSIYNEYIRGATKRNLEWNLTPQDIEALWIAQDGRCKITGVPLHCGKFSGSHTWSLDRIESNKHYTKDNVQLVSKTYNMVKGPRTDEEMQLIAYLISQNLTHEKLRVYNNMTLTEVSSILRACATVSRK